MVILKYFKFSRPKFFDDLPYQTPVKKLKKFETGFENLTTGAFNCYVRERMEHEAPPPPVRVRRTISQYIRN